MHAIQIARHGGPEVLSVREIPQPTPGVGEVLVRTVASSLNPVDWKTRAGEVGPQLPATLGWDLAGVVGRHLHLLGDVRHRRRRDLSRALREPRPDLEGFQQQGAAQPVRPGRARQGG